MATESHLTDQDQELELEGADSHQHESSCCDRLHTPASIDGQSQSRTPSCRRSGVMVYR